MFCYDSEGYFIWWAVGRFVMDDKCVDLPKLIVRNENGFLGAFICSLIFAVITVFIVPDGGPRWLPFCPPMAFFCAWLMVFVPVHRVKRRGESMEGTVRFMDSRCRAGRGWILYVQYREDGICKLARVWVTDRYRRESHLREGDVLPIVVYGEDVICNADFGWLEI